MSDLDVVSLLQVQETVSIWNLCVVACPLVELNGKYGCGDNLHIVCL